ncbi:SAM-dependent methyltransferase [Actinocorallia longicatena]|uniref:OmpR/PhoB-type domain-containing protein n=1 Tax=Actinocorallia longicatena TaxID=111803 RepID=A0ABP6Q1V1_9ACTN
MRVKVLRAEIEVHDDEGRQVPLQPMTRAALAALVLAEGRPLSSARLKELLWEAERDERKLNSRLTSVMARLRVLLGPERLLTVGDGYRFLANQYDFVDLGVANALTDRGRALDLRARALLFEGVLGMWDPVVLMGQPRTRAMCDELDRLRLRRSLLVEEHAEILLRLGSSRELTASLPELVAADPLNEYLRGLLMQALYLSGRKGDALRLYAEGETAIQAELGSNPGARLQELAAWIDANDPRLEPLPVPLDEGDARVEASGGDPHRSSASRILGAVLQLPYHSYKDRAAAHSMLAAVPDVQDPAYDGEQFAARVVRHALKEGIDQIIDIGCVAPGPHSPHEVIDLVAPGRGRVVYTSHDLPLIRFSAEHVTRDFVAFQHADLRDPGSILSSPAVERLIDLDRRVLVMVKEQLNYIPDEQSPEVLIGKLVDAVPRGSWFAFKIAAREGLADIVAEQLASVFDGLPPLVLRTKDQTTALFAGLRLLPPGVTEVNAIWTDRPPRGGRLRAYGGVAVKD